MSLDISCSEGSYLSTFMLQVVASTSLEGKPAGERISIYPNPTDGLLTLKFGNPVKQVKLVITDMTGRLITVRDLDNQSHLYSLDVGHLEAGPYLLQLVNDQFSVVRKIIVE